MDLFNNLRHPPRPQASNLVGDGDGNLRRGRRRPGDAQLMRHRLGAEAARREARARLGGGVVEVRAVA